MELLLNILSNFASILLLAAGLGLVIFVHELGHFAVAKWMGVLVERFSIGFGPILWSFRRGETEYAISSIPFGGYVKMLGQDDANPGEMVREDIRLNPRSYPAQSVPRRMAIISAGVVMNLIFGFIFFLVVYNVGVPYTPAIINDVEPGGRAWQAGISRGDKVLRVNGEEVIEFEQLFTRVALAEPERGLDLEVERDGKTLSFHVVPEIKESAPQIGVSPASDLVVHSQKPVQPGMAAAETTGAGFQQGDRITQVNGEPVHTFPEFATVLAQRAAEAIVVRVKRSGSAGETADIEVAPQFIRDWGLRFQMGKVAAIRAGSPAATAGIRAGDTIESVGGEPCDPLRLPNVLSSYAGREVELQFKRDSQGEQQTQTITIVPDATQPPWLTPPRLGGSPLLTVPAIGIAYQLIPAITESPRPGSAAERAGLQKNDRVSAVTMIVPGEDKAKKPEEQKYVIDDGKHPLLPAIFWDYQSIPDAQVRLTVKRDGKEVLTEAFTPELDPNWPAPFRGIRMNRPLTEELPPQGFSQAIALGYEETKSTITTIYLMLRRLIFSRTVSPKLLSGPVGIVQAGFHFASMDIRSFVKFLAMLSVNLAIINFLPIPVLDGGHMVLLGWEGIRGKPASERVVIAVNYCGLLLIICLALFVTWNDLLRLL